LTSLARKIGAHAPDLSRWAAGDRPVPVERCVAIESATGGAVSRIDLKPFDWQQIWPELKNKKEAA
jgi:DNA-binding transcriptional regulator YdaS (Cro superfamily)